MLNVKDMEALIRIHDAYDMLNETLMGSELLLAPHEGVLGAFSQIHDVIERNSAKRLQKKNCRGVWKIADNRSLTPEKRAKMLLEGMNQVSCS